jgi:DNA end-binding protein Ku
MPRAVWKGAVSFGLVNIPVKLYRATRDRSISFHMLHRECKTPVKYRKWCPTCQREVEEGDLVRAFELVKGKFVELTDEELEGLRVKSTKIIEISGFVGLQDIDAIYFSDHYYLVPEEGGERAYALLLQALRDTGSAAIGKLTMRNKEHPVLLRPGDTCINLVLLHHPDEIVGSGELPEIQRMPETSERERELARKLVEQMRGEFRPEEFRDTYREAVLALVRQKAEGAAVSIEKPAEAPATVDLMKALEESLKTAERKRAPT